MIPVRQSIGGLGNLMFKQAYLYTQFRRGLIPDIYLQSPTFWDNPEEIRALFSEGIGPKIDKVSLHIRKGDYVNNDFYIDLTQTNYYQEAVKQFPDAEFVVFCKDNQNKNRDLLDRGFARDFVASLGVPFTMAPEGTEIEDMNLMASCEGHIVANSTFSWWGAFLGKGKTVAPKQWFSDGISRVGLFPYWIQI